MKTQRSLFATLTGLVLLALVVASCAQPLIVAPSGNDGAGDATALGPAAEPAGNLAFVDAVTIEERLAHRYAVVTGNYPDSCTRISDVEQSVEGNTISITLLTARPEGFGCAQMMAPFEVAILLELGGLLPGEYTVIVNDFATTSFTLAL